MIKISVNDSFEDIKIKLLPIKDEICIVHNRKVKDDYIVTFDENIEFIKARLSIISAEDFNAEKRVEYIGSENIEMAGRVDFLN